MGERKVALFCCIPDADTSLNYLVGMIYSQLFQTLYYMADRVHGGALPVPVNCIMDEFPNVSLPNEFEKILATCRSRSIYCSIIIQNMSQLKALFKDSWESLVGNCDEFLYLGGNEKETHKYVSELLGKETIDTNTYGQTKGKSGSYSTNFQQSGRELLQPDEVRMLDNQNALLFIRGERPILDAKYDLMKHPNIRYTEDGGAGPFNYAKAPLAHDDFMFDETRYDDYELLLDVGMLHQVILGIQMCIRDSAKGHQLFAQLPDVIVDDTALRVDIGFLVGKVTKQSCSDAAKIVQNRYKFCPIICKICYLIRFRTFKNSNSTR